MRPHTFSRSAEIDEPGGCHVFQGQTQMDRGNSLCFGLPPGLVTTDDLRQFKGMLRYPGKVAVAFVVQQLFDIVGYERVDSACMAAGVK